MNKQTPDLRGRVCLITGASNGVGQATAMALAGAGAKLYLLCRNQQKADDTKRKIIQTTQNENIELLMGDLSSLADVRAVAERFLASNDPLHILINNAGLITTQRQTSADGYELMFAVNHLAHHLLTTLLLDRMKRSAPARIVNVSSQGHAFSRGINCDNGQLERSFSIFKGYGQSKLCILLFTYRLAQLLKETGVTVNAVHPGAVSTGLGTQNGWYSKRIFDLLRPFFRSPEQGAETSVYVSTSSQLDGVSGKYFVNCKQKKPKPWALDEKAAVELWRLSEQLLKLR